MTRRRAGRGFALIIAPRRRVERGFALIIVLWSVALIALMVTNVTASGRADVRMAASLRAAAVARAAVDGAVDEAIFRLSAGQWPREAQTQQLHIGATTVQVVVSDEAGKVNINLPPYPLLVSLMQSIGLPPQQAASLTSAVREWVLGAANDATYAAAGLPYGPTGHAFRTLDELNLVAGMTPDILARLAPHVSAVTVAAPDLTKADPVVVHAFADAGPNGGYGPGALSPQGTAVLRITARSLAPAGVAQRSATVRLPGPDEPGPAYALMSWE